SRSTGSTPWRPPPGPAASSPWRWWRASARRRGRARRWPPSCRDSPAWAGSACSSSPSRGATTPGPSPAGSPPRGAPPTRRGGFSRRWTTTYGRVLIAKLSIVAVLVGLGAVARYALLPRLAPSSAARGIGARAFRMARLVLSRGHGAPSTPAESRLVAYVKIEALVGLAVFACTAVLGEVTPGRHVTFERKHTTPVPPVTRPSARGPP